MNKQAFLAQLRKGLSGIPQGDIEERVTFYGEIIDDRIEEGLSEEDAVGAIGPVDAIISQILAEAAPATAKTAKQKKKLKAWEIVLLVLGCPLWLSLLIAAFAVIFSLYASLWSVIVSLWAAFAAVIGCAFSGMVAGIGFTLGGDALTGLAIIAAGLVCTGLAIFLFFGCKAATKGALLLVKKIVLWLKNCLVRKEGA